MSAGPLLQKLRRQVQELAEIVLADRHEKELLQKKIVSLQEEIAALKTRPVRTEGPTNPSVEEKQSPQPLP
jgi:hypothetical protein